MMVHSPGGIIEATKKIGVMLRARVEKLTMIVPEMAKSAVVIQMIYDTTQYGTPYLGTFRMDEMGMYGRPVAS